MYSEYADVPVDEYHYGAFVKGDISDEEDNGVVQTSKGTILMLKTEFYKTNVPVYKSSLSKVENQLTVEQEKQQQKQQKMETQLTIQQIIQTTQLTQLIQQIQRIVQIQLTQQIKR